MRPLTLVFLLLASCVTAEERDRAASVALLDADVATGEALYGTNCAICHGAVGEGGSAPALTGEDDVEGVVIRMLRGPESMPSYADWQDQDLADVAGFVLDL